VQIGPHRHQSKHDPSGPASLTAREYQFRRPHFEQCQRQKQRLRREARGRAGERNNRPGDQPDARNLPRKMAHQEAGGEPRRRREQQGKPFPAGADERERHRRFGEPFLRPPGMPRKGEGERIDAQDGAVL